MTAHTVLKSRATGTVLTLGIVALAATTSYVHLTLGGLLFMLNGLGYAGLIVLVVLGAIAPHPLIARFDWFPRLALIGYTAMTIAGYLVIGPYFALGSLFRTRLDHEGRRARPDRPRGARRDPRVRQPVGDGSPGHRIGHWPPWPSTDLATWR